MIGVGYSGMAFFFILSGFVLTVSSWDREIGYKDFVVARLSRIYPAFFVAFLLTVPLTFSASTSVQIMNVFTNVTLIQAWFPSFWTLGANGGTWSISVEMLFYLLFPFLFPMMSRIHFRPSVAFLVFGVLWLITFLPALCLYAMPTPGMMISYYSVPPYRLAEFMCGIALAIAWKRKVFPASIISVAITGFIFVEMAFCKATTNNLTMLNMASVPLFLCLIHYAADKRPAFLEWKPLVYLGDISYGIYMYQFVVFAYVLPRLGGLGALPKAALCLVATLAISAMSHALLETPLRNWVRKTFKAARTPQLVREVAAGDLEVGRVGGAAVAQVGVHSRAH